MSIAVGKSGDWSNHHGVQDVTAVNILKKFYPLIDENHIGLTDGANPTLTITDLEFWWCSTIADEPGASAHPLLSVG